MNPGGGIPPGGGKGMPIGGPLGPGLPAGGKGGNGIPRPPGAVERVSWLSTESPERRRRRSGARHTGHETWSSRAGHTHLEGWWWHPPWTLLALMYLNIPNSGGPLFERKTG